MLPTRAALTLPALLVLSGCGVASATTLRTTTVSVASRDVAPHLVSPPPTSAPQSATPAPVTAAPAPSQTELVATVPISAGQEWLEILAPSGRVIARTQINPTLVWMTGAGAGGAYWTQNGVEHELTPSGLIRSLGSVPKDATGVVIGPDGTSFAYATADQTASGSITNRIVVVRPGGGSATVADRVSDPTHPTADAPSSWNYYLIGWNASGIAFARVLSGGCGCGSFDMQMQSAYSAVINPTSGAVTTLTADTACPLSTVGAGLETVCFAAGPTATDAIRIASGGTTIHTYSMSGTSLAGDAVFAPGGNALAYVTIPVSQNTCGATVTPTLHVLNLATGGVVARNVGDFAPAAWTSGPIYGDLTIGATTWLAAVDPTTFALTRLATGAVLVGIM
jgi:hypothetical protein